MTPATPPARGPEALALLPPIPPSDDPTAWADWWHSWARLGRLAARLDPAGALYEPVYTGDQALPHYPVARPERGDAP
jgi:hypothetical protein